MPDLIIRRCTVEDFQGMAPAMKSEGLIINPNASYFGAWLDSRLIGIAGIVWRAGSCKFTADYIILEERRKGYFKMLFDHCLSLARGAGKRYVTAYCTAAALPFWLMRGARITSRYRHTTKVRLTL